MDPSDETIPTEVDRWGPKCSRLCLICRAPMVEEHRIVFKDYWCSSSDHSFGERVRGRDVEVVKVRVRDAWGGRLCLKLYYDEGYSEVWEGTDNVRRSTIPMLIDVDLTDVKAIRRVILFWLKKKIRLRWTLQPRPAG